MQLDEDAILRVEQKKLKALDLRAQRAKSVESISSPCEVPSPVQCYKQDINDLTVATEASPTIAVEDLCSCCGSKNIDKLYLDVYGERVCRDCIHSTDEYGQMIKQDVLSEFLLSDYSVKSLPYQLKDNPHHRGWNQMKLYLRKHAYVAAMKKWGSEEALQREKEERGNKSLKRKLGEAENFFSTIKSSGATSDAMSQTQTSGASKKQRQRTYMKNLVSKLRSDNK